MMQIFVTGTDTNVGKTVVSAWLCLHSGYRYWKPIQSGTIEGSDSEFVSKFGVKTYSEQYCFAAPLSPHAAAALEHQTIDCSKIVIPTSDPLIIEGAGGVMVPLNQEMLVIDLIRQLGTPAIVVARSELGTINHTVLTIQALRARSIPILGVIMNGPDNPGNKQAIEYYGQVKVVASLPRLSSLELLKSTKFSPELRALLPTTH